MSYSRELSNLLQNISNGRPVRFLTGGDFRSFFSWTSLLVNSEFFLIEKYLFPNVNTTILFLLWLIIFGIFGILLIEKVQPQYDSLHLPQNLLMLQYFAVQYRKECLYTDLSFEVASPSVNQIFMLWAFYGEEFMTLFQVIVKMMNSLLTEVENIFSFWNLWFIIPLTGVEILI